MKEDLTFLRGEIDAVDEELMKLLDRRFRLTDRVGRIKFASGKKIEDSGREKEILARVAPGPRRRAVEAVYKRIFSESKKRQKYDYFLLGENIERSLSPEIYRLLGLAGYNVFPAPDAGILTTGEYKGANVTAPHKGAAFVMADWTSHEAKVTQTVNTVIKKAGKIYGYNTDYAGFEAMLEYYRIDPAGRKIAIIGNGATARTISAVLAKRDPQRLVFLVRSPRGKNEYSLESFSSFVDSEIIINATPYGAAGGKPLFPLDGFTDLKTVIDLLYYPARTPLLLEAERLKVPAYNGLYMLVGQAVEAYKIFTGIDKTRDAERIYRELKREAANIVLIGMPYGGKTTLGGVLSKKLGRRFVDIDAELASAGVFLNPENEGAFRAKEAEITIRYARERGLVISTGGGIVLNPEAMACLRANGIILYLDTPLSVLRGRLDGTRPLAREPGDLDRLYEERAGLYRRYADITVSAGEIKQIGVIVDEYFSR